MIEKKRWKNAHPTIWNYSLVYHRDQYTPTFDHGMWEERNPQGLSKIETINMPQKDDVELSRMKFDDGDQYSMFWQSRAKILRNLLKFATFGFWELSLVSSKRWGVRERERERESDG